MFGGFLSCTGSFGDRGFLKWLLIVNLINLTAAFVFAFVIGLGLAIGWSLGS